MELLTLDSVHLTYPPRFRTDGGAGGGDEGDGLDGDEVGAQEEAEEVGEREERGSRSEPTVALRGVSLTVSAGESVGLLGHVGSGRTTLLSVITGVLRPDVGTVRIRGTAASLVAAGAGFFADLSVRRNIVRNAVLMGMSKAAATASVHDVATFAGLQAALDQPLRSLSRADTKRLGYAVAMHAQPTILLGDEELVVGPKEMREAGLERLAAFPGDDRALIVATNRGDQLKRLCRRAVVLEHGEVAFDGPLEDGLTWFRRSKRQPDS